MSSLQMICDEDDDCGYGITFNKRQRQRQSDNDDSKCGPYRNNWDGDFDDKIDDGATPNNNNVKDLYALLADDTCM